MDESAAQSPFPKSPILKSKKLWIVVAAVLVVGLAASGFVAWRMWASTQLSPTQTVGMSADATQLAQQLSNGHCQGTGSKKLGSAPLKAADLGTIVPYGLMVQAHVTPIDHQYYYGVDPRAPRDTYDVLAPGDGTIVNVQHRVNYVGQSSNARQTDDWRVVITYTCSFYSYYDLMTSLDSSVKDKMPSGWNSNNSSGVDIPVKEGQVIGKVGAQSLDFAVWDLEKPLKGLLVPIAYSAEPWKPYTAPPLDYFSDTVKAEVTPHYVRSVAPIDGKMDYDLEGKLSGSWFKVGTNGYAGTYDRSKQVNYWETHLAFVYNNIDPSMIELSIGNFDGQSVQYAVNGNSPDPAKVDASKGLVKYELVQFDFFANGTRWDGASVAKGIKAQVGSEVMGTVLVQVTGAHEMKFEAFPRKTASEVSGFDSNAVMYNRGDDAKASQ